MARILLRKSYKFSDKNCYTYGDNEFFLRDCFLVGAPCSLHLWCAERDGKMPTTVVYNVYSMLLLLVAVITSLQLVRYLAVACDIEAVRESSREQVPGGWSGVAVDDRSVVQLKQSVANDAVVVRAHQVVESYQQVGHVTSIKSVNMMHLFCRCHAEVSRRRQRMTVSGVACRHSYDVVSSAIVACNYCVQHAAMIAGLQINMH